MIKDEIKALDNQMDWAPIANDNGNNNVTQNSNVGVRSQNLINVSNNDRSRRSPVSIPNLLNEVVEPESVSNNMLRNIRNNTNLRDIAIARNNNNNNNTSNISIASNDDNPTANNDILNIQFNSNSSRGSSRNRPLSSNAEIRKDIKKRHLNLKKYGLNENSDTGI